MYIHGVTGYAYLTVILSHAGPEKWYHLDNRPVGMQQLKIPVTPFTGGTRSSHTSVYDSAHTSTRFRQGF